MPEDKIDYKRLPGKAWLSFYRNDLWLGPDHLLSIKTHGYTEEYKRFYFADIQAIVLRRSFSGKWISLILGLVLASLLAVVVAGSLQPRWGIWAITSAVFAIPFVFLFILFLFQGRTCICSIYTAVHSEELNALKRVKTAMKTIRMLQPYIESAQGTLSREDLIRRTGVSL